MKVLITADIHCGVPDRLNDCMWALRTMREYAKQNGIEVVVVLGDLFHNRVDINIKILSEISQFLDEAKFEYDQEWVMFPGNHDMFMRHSWDVNSLSGFRRIATLLDDVALIKIHGRKFRIIPFIQHEDMYMEVLEKVNKRASDDEILLTHIGTTGAKYNSCFLMKHWGHVNFDETKFKKIFVGHFHVHQEFKNVYIPGSPIPFRHDEGMVAHGFYTLDLDTDEVDFVDIDVGKELIGGVSPPEFWTITEEGLNNIPDPVNTNIRIMLDSPKNRDELDRIKHDLMTKGALKVVFMKTKEKDELSPAEDVGSVGTMDPLTLFDKFLEADKPALDKQMLRNLNKKIIEESFEQVQALQEEDDSFE
jgi:DNA repair exonuclease SbcCD nuclease subunit